MPLGVSRGPSLAGTAARLPGKLLVIDALGRDKAAAGGVVMMSGAGPW